MRHKNPNQNRRESCRFLVVDTLQRCELQVGEELLSARMLDESAGGFAVLVEHLAGLSVDQTAHLHTAAGWFKVRVANLTEIEPSEDDATVEAETSGPWFRLGLQRLGEAPPPEPPAVSPLSGIFRLRGGRWRPPHEVPWVLGVCLAVSVVAIPAVVITALWYAGHTRGKWLPQKVDALPARLTPGQWAEQVLPDDGRLPFNFDGAPKSMQSLSLSGQRLANTLRRLPGATPLELPEVADLLELTADQRKKIADIVESAFQAMRDLDNTLAGGQRQHIAEYRDQLHEDALREALGLLTAEQRSRWDELMGMRQSDAKDVRK